MIQYDVRPCKRTRYEYDEMTGDIIVMYGRVLDPGRTCALTHAVLTTVAHAHTHTHTMAQEKKLGIVVPPATRV